jgi:hypothetical protein
VFEKAKSLYMVWYEYYRILPTTHRYTLGQKVDKYFTEIIESITIAAFLKSEEKIPYVRLAIRKSDVLKVFLYILWETKSLDDSKYILLSDKLNSVGRDLGGWSGSLVAKKNSPAKEGEQK